MASKREPEPERDWISHEPAEAERAPMMAEERTESTLYTVTLGRRVGTQTVYSAHRVVAPDQAAALAELARVCGTSAEDLPVVAVEPNGR